jgi:hypothetical protein
VVVSNKWAAVSLLVVWGAVALCVFPFYASGQSVHYKHIRWRDPNPADAGGFVVHVSKPDGSIEDLVYGFEDPGLGVYLFVYGVFIVVDEGESCVAISRFGEDGAWSQSSEPWCFQHDQPEKTVCDRADLNRDGIVGGPDFTLLASVFNERCD